MASSSRPTIDLETAPLADLRSYVEKLVEVRAKLRAALDGTDLSEAQRGSYEKAFEETKTRVAAVRAAIAQRQSVARRDPADDELLADVLGLALPTQRPPKAAPAVKAEPLVEPRRKSGKRARERSRSRSRSVSQGEGTSRRPPAKRAKAAVEASDKCFDPVRTPSTLAPQANEIASAMRTLRTPEPRMSSPGVSGDEDLRRVPHVPHRVLALGGG